MVARVSNQMMLDVMQGDLRRTYQQFYEAQRRASTGKRVVEASDDPTAKQTLMRNRDQLQSLEVFDRNTSAARTQFRSAESAYGEATDVLQRARELAIKASSDSNTPFLRANASARPRITQLTTMRGMNMPRLSDREKK